MIAAEDEGVINVTVQVTNTLPAGDSVSVTVNTLDETALAGEDYTSVTELFEFNLH